MPEKKVGEVEVVEAPEVSSVETEGADIEQQARDTAQKTKDTIERTKTVLLAEQANGVDVSNELQRLNEMSEEAAQLESGFFRRMWEVVRHPGEAIKEYKEKKWQVELAKPDNPVVWELLEVRIEEVGRGDKRNKRLSKPHFFLEKDYADIKTIAADFKKSAKMFPRDVDYLAEKIGYLVHQVIEDCIQKNDVEGVLGAWDLMPSTAFLFHDAQKKMMGFLENLAKDNPTLLAEVYANHPDIPARQTLLDWQLDTYPYNRQKTPEKQAHALVTLARDPNRNSLITYPPSFPTEWEKALSQFEKQVIFDACLTAQPRVIINNFSFFKNEFDALTPERRAFFMTAVAGRVAPIFGSKWHRATDEERFHSQNQFDAFFEKVTLTPADIDIFTERLAPRENVLVKRHVSVGERDIYITKAQDTIKANIRRSLLYRSSEAVLKNAAFFYGQPFPPDASKVERADMLLEMLISRGAYEEIFDYLRQEIYFSQAFFTKEQQLKVVELLIDQSFPLSCSAIPTIEIYSKNLGLSEVYRKKLVTYYLKNGGDDALTGVMSKERDFSYNNLDTTQKELFFALIQSAITDDKHVLFMMWKSFDQRNLGNTDNNSIPASARPFVIYCRHMDVFDLAVFDQFSSMYIQGSNESATLYLEGLYAATKELVQSGTPKAARARPEYMYLVKQVYPSGNYSNHRSNVACGDKLEHLAGYTFDKQGYAVELSGLLGYKLAAGKEENQKLYKSYEDRLVNIREFVASRGPDNAALQEAFDVKVQGLFDEHVASEYKAIQDLSSKEKMLALFITEAARKTKTKNFVPNSEILDLVVEYKYAYHENLEAYVQHSAGDVLQYKDKTSQQHILWQELSTIYGENVKHVLRHNIFEDLAKNGKHYEEIVKAFGLLIGEIAEGRELKPKQMERIANTFTNERIPIEKRFDTLYKQVQAIFGSNIIFANEEERGYFEEELQAALKGVRDTFTAEQFQQAIPTLFALRERYRFGVNAKLEELFQLDLNVINQEVAKYEEVIEVENKEKRMGGPKDKEVKKSTKQRHIKSYFTKTKESANARMGAFICIAGEEGMWKNKNYFELVDFDVDAGKCVGVTMLLNINANDGKRYLWMGPNPFESTLTQVSAEKMFNHQYDTVCAFAKENNFDGVVVPSEEGQILGACTNRGGTFPDLIKAKRLRNKNGELKVVQFGKKHILGGSYGYEDGALIWKK